jgi:hypothetical protein
VKGPESSLDRRALQSTCQRRTEHGTQAGKAEKVESVH